MEKINTLLEKYVQSVNDCDLKTAEAIWDNEETVSFIHPNGYEHSFDEVRTHFYMGTMGRLFSKRDLRLKDIQAKVYGNTAFLEFRWDFYATLNDTGNPIHTQGRETQFLVLRKNNWKISNIHYSAEPQ